MNMALQAAENFIGQGKSITSVERYGKGLIHDTYLVELDGRADSFILQRINTQVFKQPELIMHNLRLVCEHVHDLKKLAGRGIDSGWKMLHIIPTRNNRDFFIDPEGGFWRALSFINGTKPLYNGTQWQLQTVERERLEQHIRDVMFSDLIREPSANVGTKSQFEVAKRIERAQRILGQAVGRQRWERICGPCERGITTFNLHGAHVRPDRVFPCRGEVVHTGLCIPICGVATRGQRQPTRALSGQLPSIRGHGPCQRGRFN